MKPRERYVFLLLLGIFAAIWNLYVWTTSDPPDLGAPIPVMSVLLLALVYFVSAIQWLVSKAKGRENKQP